MHVEACGRCIDWFLVCEFGRRHSGAVQIRRDAFTRLHIPVTVSFKPSLPRLKKLVVDALAKIPLENMMEPLQTPPKARRPTTVAPKALDPAMSGQPWEKADQDMAGACKEYAKLWELELFRRTEAQHRSHKGLTRGTFPRLMWRPLIKETSRDMIATTCGKTPF